MAKGRKSENEGQGPILALLGYGNSLFYLNTKNIPGLSVIADKSLYQFKL